MEQNEYDLVLFITALAIAISKQVTNNDDLLLLATSLEQLGETLETIALQRSRVSFTKE